MRTTLQLLIPTLLGRHPSAEILQACSDLELRGLANRLVRFHIGRCEQCQQELRDAEDILNLFRFEEVPPMQLANVRERIVTAMSAVSAEQQGAINDVRCLLGARAADRLTDGHVTPELRVELAAFIGGRAADTLLQRMAA